MPSDSRSRFVVSFADQPAPDAAGARSRVIVPYRLTDLGAEPRFRGCVDVVDGRIVSGWALDGTDPGRPLTLQIWVAGRRLGSVATGHPRDEIAAFLRRQVAPGFRFDLGALDLPAIFPALQRLHQMAEAAIPVSAMIAVSIAQMDAHLPFAPALADHRVSAGALAARLRSGGGLTAPVPAPEAPPPPTAAVPQSLPRPSPQATPQATAQATPQAAPLSTHETLPESLPQTLPQTLRHPDAAPIEPFFDAAFYLAGFLPADRPADPVTHYLTMGWLQGRDPAPWFSSWHYLALHPDVAAAGMNPFLHYAVQGHGEGRVLQKLGRPPAGDVFAAHAFATSAGPHFEEFDPTIGVGRTPRAKVLAYYLPQFHPVPVNDRNWGAGFTEWRNLPRGMPRFEGHIQPRIPRDLGTYSLAEGEAMRRQIAMAKAGGIHGFCFYHYWFDGQRALETPMERLLADPSLDMPFCLMWANENWTRTWDGADKEVILQQSYRPEDEVPFIDDLARHMQDARYIRLDGRPLLFIYRPGQVPDTAATIARWRAMFAERHKLDPLILMAQAFGHDDPRAFDLDGAIEFPPHKILSRARPIAGETQVFDPHFTGDIRSYDDVAAAAKADPRPDFPLIRTVFPSWDNDARRPGRGTIFKGSTPAAFADWLDWAVRQAQADPVHGEALVCINAWNEWAEGAYLEPDVHFGAAYLNAAARVVHGVAVGAPRGKVLLVGHDALAFGAQRLLAHIGTALVQDFGCEVAFMIADGNMHGGDYGSLMEAYAALGPVTLAPPDAAGPALADLRAKGFTAALTNTAVTGAFLPALRAAGFATVSLIHELPNMLRSYGLQQPAAAIAALADRVVFPARVVQDGFTAFAGAVANRAEVLPQGLYNTAVLDQPRGDHGLRAELGLPAGTRIVLGVGYADLRKGIDRFLATGLSVCGQNDDVAFLWAGTAAAEAVGWLAPDIAAAGLATRVRILGQRDDIARLFAAADLFYLSSREDPFPSVVLEALAAGLPVVGHAGTGGCDDLIRQHGTLVPATDPLGAAEAILTALDTPDRGQRRAKARRAAILRDHRFDAYAFGLLQRLLPGLPAVSAVVPNYNYERHIGPRLRSVFDQTHPLREVIVLDDASPDGSVAVIREVAAAAGRRIALHVNAQNTGSPFAQWRRGAEMAQGTYVWIAEADDLCDPALVDRLVTRMEAAGSAIGFCDSRQINGEDVETGTTYRPYMSEFAAGGRGGGAFDRAFDMDGTAFLSRFLAVRNVILNVSAVVFRREALLAALEAVGDELLDYGVAGDWRLYAEICAAGGGVSWLPDPLNTHRRHAVSVTHALKVERHLAEITEMQGRIGGIVTLDPATKAAQLAHLEGCRRHLGVA